MSVPFTTFEGWLKCIRLDRMNEHLSNAMKASFPAFFEEPKPHPETLAEARKLNIPAEPPYVYQRFSGGPDLFDAERLVEKPFNYRRYAGGPDLPRNRYFSVCYDSAGYDA
jgi:hypothetical protein